ncbi:hypothetical protein BON30_11715 [Cystobacter ferrugineus]|uniref:Uncharacterized protein n=1 Tax=Cystobacter ferrugineus TaxID=83449 RepID=A0A1L9BGY0_9BACT|nr:hypothetical protein BON30_11715 [Cystobacter ferrugineus]
MSLEDLKTKEPKGTQEQKAEGPRRQTRARKAKGKEQTPEPTGAQGQAPEEASPSATAPT